MHLPTKVDPGAVGAHESLKNSYMTAVKAGMRTMLACIKRDMPTERRAAGENLPTSDASPSQAGAFSYQFTQSEESYPAIPVVPTYEAGLPKLPLISEFPESRMEQTRPPAQKSSRPRGADWPAVRYAGRRGAVRQGIRNSIRSENFAGADLAVAQLIGTALRMENAAARAEAHASDKQNFKTHVRAGISVSHSSTNWEEEDEQAFDFSPSLSLIAESNALGESIFEDMPKRAYPNYENVFQDNYGQADELPLDDQHLIRAVYSQMPADVVVATAPKVIDRDKVAPAMVSMEDEGSIPKVSPFILTPSNKSRKKNARSARP